MPAAIAPGTPWCDLTGAGDSLKANAFVDNVPVSGTGWIAGAARLYAAGRDLAHPLISPINGDFAGFPPAILTSGTRELLLSDTVRADRALRHARVEAALQVFEGQSHAQFLDRPAGGGGGLRRHRAIPGPASVVNGIAEMFMLCS